MLSKINTHFYAGVFQTELSQSSCPVSSSAGFLGMHENDKMSIGGKGFDALAETAFLCTKAAKAHFPGGMCQTPFCDFLLFF
jgi:hypothetical protein